MGHSNHWLSYWNSMVRSGGWNLLMSLFWCISDIFCVLKHGMMAIVKSMINQVGQSDYFWWLIMKSQPKTSPKTVKPPVQISQRKRLYMYLTVLKFSNLQYIITGIWPWRLRWLSRWWTKEIFWNHTRRVQKWTNCKSNTVMTLLYHYALW